MRFTLSGDAVYGALGALQEIGALDAPIALGLKLAKITRAVRTAALDIQEQREKIRAKYARRFPADHPTHAGQPVPVYKDGTKAEDRRPTNTAAILPGAMEFDDDAAVTEALVELGKTENEIECPTLTSDELAGVLRVKSSTLELLLWNIDAELPADAKPEQRRRRAGLTMRTK